MSIREMYDGINSLAAGIHKDFPAAEVVAGYINGAYAWDANDWAYFPHAQHVLISVLSTENAGDVIDCENGDATPQEAADWVRLRRAGGMYQPVVYTSLENVPAVREATGSLKLGTDYSIWVADWTGSPHQVTSEITGGATVALPATQYRSTADWDVSVIYDDPWPIRVNPTAGAVTSGNQAWPASIELQYGSSGTPVKALQEALNATDHYGCRGLAVDGAFGVMTRTAVRNFEAWQDLTIDGIAGPQVRGRLISGRYLT